MNGKQGHWISIYPIIFLDGIYHKVRDDGNVKTKVVCNIIAINMEGKKEIIRSYITENEGSKFWLEVLTDLANRGVKDMTYSMRRWPERFL